MKNWFGNLRIKHKLFLSFSLLLFIIIVFIYAYFPAKQRDSVYTQMNRRIIYLARSLGLSYASAMADKNYSILAEIGSWVREDNSFSYYYIYDEVGEFFMSYPDDSPKRDMDPAMKDTQPVMNENFIEVKISILYKDKFYGTIILGMHLNEVKAEIGRINRISTLVLALLFILGLGILLFIASLINHPVDLLMESVNHISAHGDYSERVEIQTKDEIGMLSHQFNAMVELVEERDIELKQQFEELHKMNQLKDDFLAATTHDLRSPITAILGFSDLILMNQDMDKGDRERVSHIRKSAEFLANLVNHVLDISRLESGKAQLRLKPLQVANVIQSSVNTLQYMALPKEIPIVFEDRSSGHNWVEGDFDALLRVMNNLISNSIKFTPKGGNIRTILDVEGEVVKVSVEDTGIGIPAEKVPHLFETYSPISQFGTDGEKGTGLGLSITHKLILKHHGQIQVASQVGKGSCFSFTLPRYSGRNDSLLAGHDKV